MYKQISIKNIKTFSKEQNLKIATLTLLYGENSSGKTTLLKTFDIIHNIFSEQEVKRGKNVSQKDSPFYRNENIQNISSKKPCVIDVISTMTPNIKASGYWAVNDIFSKKWDGNPF